MTAPRAAALALVAALSLAGGAFAQEDDFVVTDGKLSTEDFYRLVSCGAAPGSYCTAATAHWPPETAHALTVGFAPVPPGYPASLASELDRALDRVIADINSVGADLHLERAPKKAPALVTIYLTETGAGEVVTGTGVSGVDGVVIGAALVNVWWDDDDHITEAVIAFADDLYQSEALPVLLEEVTQSLGLLTDIRNPAYTGVSVFSEDSNNVTKLAPQDRAAILRHYPPPERAP